MNYAKRSRIRYRDRAGTTTPTARSATSVPGKRRSLGITPCNSSGQTRTQAASEVSQLSGIAEACLSFNRPSNDKPWSARTLVTYPGPPGAHQNSHRHHVGLLGRHEATERRSFSSRQEQLSRRTSDRSSGDSHPPGYELANHQRAKQPSHPKPATSRNHSIAGSRPS